MMVLLNSRHVENRGRSGWLSNGLLAGSTLLFVVILANMIQTELP